MPELTGHQDLRSGLRMFWRWKFLFLSFVLGAPLVAYIVQDGKPTTYSSSALVGIDQTTVNTAVISSINGGSFSTSNVLAIAQLVTAPAIADIAAGLLHPPARPDQIAGEVSATGDQTTNFVTVTAVDRSPTRAAEIANAFARAISLNREQSAINELDSAISGIRSQLAHAGRKDASARSSLEQQLSQLQASRSTQGSNAAVLRPATAGALAGPPLRRGVEIALVVGVLLGFGAVVFAEKADRRIRMPDELKDIAESPVLTTVAPSALSAELQTTPEDEDAFQMLRIALASYHVERPVNTLVVASPAEKEGKTTVASRLAVAMVQAGMNVILVDADLRRGALSGRFGFRGRPGLGGVLARELSSAEALVDYPIEDTAGRLRVLPAGPPPRHASTLISSQLMRDVLSELTSESEIVIIDTPAALAVSEPLALMGNVSGVILVARMNLSRRRSLRRLKEMIDAASGTLLGVVAVGVSHGVDYYGYRRSYYGTNGGGGSGALAEVRRRVGRME